MMNITGLKMMKYFGGHQYPPGTFQEAGHLPVFRVGVQTVSLEYSVVQDAAKLEIGDQSPSKKGD